MTVTLAKMGRRKQNCPQKTGNNAPSAQSNNAPEEESEETSLQEDNTTQESDSMSINSEKEAVPSQEENHRKNSSSSNSNGMIPAPPSSVSTNNSSSGAISTTNSTTSSDPLNLFKNPLFNPALLSLNPSLYAVQLAHLQAAQLLSQASSSSDESSASRKRKIGGDEDSLGGASKRPMSPKESPLDLTKDQAKGTFSPGKLDPFTAAAALSPFFSPFLGGRPDMLLPGAAAAAAAAAEQNNSFIKNNPLERMSEIVKGPNSHPVSTPNHHYSSSNHSSSSSSSNKSSGPRHSAWQSQWINRGPENSKDIFKCVWCKDAFSSLQDLTDHMKETKHFGPQIPPPSPPQLSPGIRGAPASKPTPPPPPPSIISSSAPSPVTTSSPKARDILKEQLPMPRKLVRGQDVWLGRGEQQTKDILKCMWCGQSFRSLDLMTKHMQETKHYTKVISQEQLSSWKAGGGSGNESPASQSSPTPASSSSAASHQQQQSQSALNSVLTCKVCEVSFSTLRELGDHMVKSNHYAESKGGSNPVVSPPPPTLPPPSKEKRKKSLPVRKLLELERAQQELIISGIKSDEGKIMCEKCSEKIPVSLFASHIHLCVGSGGSSDLLRRPPSSSAASSTPPSISPPTTKQAQPEDSESENEKQPKSILGSLEKMVQSNFGASKKKSTPVGGGDANLSILQRLGIDESIPSDFSKPSNNESHHFRPIPNFLVGSGKFGSSSRSDSSECSSPDRSKHSNFPDSKDEERVEGHSLSGGAPPPKNSLPPSPAPSQRSIQDYSHREDEAGTPNSLVESKMEDTPSNTNDNSEESGRKKNPLAALQMLCDKTEKPKSSSSPHNHNNNNNNNGGHLTPSSSASPSLLPPGTSSLYSDPGAILAFSWACNQAIVNDSLLKCPFCDTPFISKGAYRHHLSKMHFVKDEKGMIGGAYAAGGSIKGPEKSPSPNETISSSSSLTNATTSAPQTSTINANPSSPSSSSASAKAENAQSKFQKYSQLAKQLSCSSQP